MGSEAPIACSLNAGDSRERLEQIREIGQEGLIRAEDRAGGVLLVFADDPSIHARLEDIVAAESSCCPFLDLELGRDARGIWLTIAAPAEAAPVVSELVASFQGA